jgi:hypothetical protein
MRQETFGDPSIESLDAAQQLSPSQNRKLAKSGIVACAPLEGPTVPCKFFAGKDLSQSPLCPGCWSAALFKVRRANGRKGRSKVQKTPRKGLVRLGTWREIPYEDWKAFKAGRGTTPAGVDWEDASLPNRFYFLITRGLEESAYYEEVSRDPKALNIQVSVDIIIDETGRTRQIPHDARLRELAAMPKVMFRFKTLSETRIHKGLTFQRNVERFVALRERLGIAPVRILETPLRLGTHSYGEDTPLQKLALPMLPSSSFMRCNSPCQDCRGENSVLACAATERILERLSKVGTATPVRAPKPPEVHIDWTTLAKTALDNLGGTSPLKAIYAEVRRLEPAVERNPILGRQGPAGPAAVQPTHRPGDVEQPHPGHPAGHRGARGRAVAPWRVPRHRKSPSAASSWLRPPAPATRARTATSASRPTRKR